MASEAADWWVAMLVRTIHAKMVSAGPGIHQVFKVPSVGEVLRGLDWLVRNGADDVFAQIAVNQALNDAVETDRVWLDALHLVVNRLVRVNATGWELYRGNWVKIKDYVEAVESGDNKEAGH